MTCAIMQPTYLPWMGYFELIDRANPFVFLDHAQIVRRSWDIRNRIKTKDGVLFLSVPIRKADARENTCFDNAVVDDRKKWREQHLKNIYHAYRKAPFFQPVYAVVENAILHSGERLSEINIALIVAIARAMSIETRYVRSSGLSGIEGRKDTLLASICRSLQCDTYLSPRGAAAYIEEHSPGGALAQSGIRLIYQDYWHPEYKQMHDGFVPHLSVIDLLFNVGFGAAPGVIRSGRSR